MLQSAMPHCLYLDTLSTSHWDKLPQSVIDQLLFYAEEGFEPFNKEMRQCGPISQEHDDMHIALNKASRTFRKGAQLFRGGIYPTNFFEQGNWCDPAWVSTSTSNLCATAHLQQEIDTYQHLLEDGTHIPVMMKLYVDKGIKAVPLSTILHMRTYVEGTSEREITLENDLHYHLLGQGWDDSILCLEISVQKQRLRSL